MEPIMASWVAARGSTVAVAAAVGICVGMDEGEGATVAVATGTVVTVAGGGSVGMGACVPGRACEITPQACDTGTIDNGKYLRTFNIPISFPSNFGCHNVTWQPDQKEINPDFLWSGLGFILI